MNSNEIDQVSRIFAEAAVSALKTLSRLYVEVENEEETLEYSIVSEFFIDKRTGSIRVEISPMAVERMHLIGGNDAD